MAEEESMIRAVAKLPMAGEQAGFTVEQMVSLLQAGLTITTLHELINWRLTRQLIPGCPHVAGANSRPDASVSTGSDSAP